MEVIVTENPDVNVRREWDSFMRINENANFFQSSLAFKIYKEVPEYHPFVCICYTSEKKIAGLLMGVIIKNKPLKYFSSRAIIVGGPLVSNKSLLQQQICKLLIESSTKYLKAKCIYIEYRNLYDMSGFMTVFQTYKYIYRPHINFIVKAGLEESVLKGMSKSKVRQIKQGLKKGAHISEVKNTDELREYYELLKDAYKKKIKKPSPPWDLIYAFYKISSTDKCGKVFIVRNAMNKIIGGIVCPIYNSIIYEWYICGNDLNFKRFYPSVLATWAPIKYALDNNIGSFDFLGAGNPDEEYGVREFKSKFGGNRVEYGRYLRINKPAIYRMGNLYIRLKTKL